MKEGRKEQINITFPFTCKKQRHYPTFLLLVPVLSYVLVDGVWHKTEPGTLSCMDRSQDHQHLSLVKMTQAPDDVSCDEMRKL